MIKLEKRFSEFSRMKFSQIKQKYSQVVSTEVVQFWRTVLRLNENMGANRTSHLTLSQKADLSKEMSQTQIFANLRVFNSFYLNAKNWSFLKIFVASTH